MTAADPPETPQPEITQASSPLKKVQAEQSNFRIQGFAHAGFASNGLSTATAQGRARGFFLGNIDALVTSHFARNLNLLAEIKLAPQYENNITLDIDRLQLSYTLNDHLQITVGRFHSSIGYHNTAYNHGSWYETAVTRPLIFLPEEAGGVLPLHNVGIAISGALPSGSFKLHYAAEIGNGRPARHPQSSGGTKFLDENGGKAFNLAAYVRPDWARGVQIGFSIHHDHLIADLPPRIEETIPAAYVVYVTPKFEFLNEAILIHHTFDYTRLKLNMPGFSTQLGRQWGHARPYVRYDYLNTAPIDSTDGSIGRIHGPSFGVRYEWSQFLALKFQYGRAYRRALAPLDTGAAVVAFQF